MGWTKDGRGIGRDSGEERKADGRLGSCVTGVERREGVGCCG